MLSHELQPYNSTAAVALDVELLLQDATLIN